MKITDDGICRPLPRVFGLTKEKTKAFGRGQQIVANKYAPSFMEDIAKMEVFASNHRNMVQSQE